MPRILEICNWTAKGVLKKKSLDFSRFKVMPEASVKSERMVLSLRASRAVGEFIRRVSSTNWLCEGAGCKLCRGRPWRVPSRTMDLM
jgi:hypothetical protein